MIPAKKTIFLVRHGTTAWNEADILQGRIEQPLSEKGLREAERVAQRLQKEPIEALFCSPMLRARQTAEAINRHLDLPLQVVPEFVEIDLGRWEGLHYPQVQEQFHREHQEWIRDSAVPVPGGESFDQVFARVYQGLQAVLQSPAGVIVIVGHATVNRALLGHLLAMPPAAARLFRTTNASLSRLVYYDSVERRSGVVDFWNDSHHLDEPI